MTDAAPDVNCSQCGNLLRNGIGQAKNPVNPTAPDEVWCIECAEATYGEGPTESQLRRDAKKRQWESR